MGSNRAIKWYGGPSFGISSDLNARSHPFEYTSVGICRGNGCSGLDATILTGCAFFV
jgi:hypothetical protein